MKMNRIVFILTISLALFSCGNNKEDSGENAKKDSLHSGQQAVQPAQPPPPMQNGLYEEKHKNGRIYMRGYYKEGKREGQWVSFYDNGLMWSEAFYENGKRNGKSVSYYENGNVRYAGLYKNDQQSGVWKFFDETGKLVNEFDFDKKK